MFVTPKKRPSKKDHGKLDFFSGLDGLSSSYVLNFEKWVGHKDVWVKRCLEFWI